LFIGGGLWFCNRVVSAGPDDATYDDDAELDFVWTAPEGFFDDYRVYVSVDGGEFELKGTSSTTSYTLTGEDGCSYRIKVTAVTSTGIEGPSSPVSNPVVCDTLFPSPPVISEIYDVLDQHTVLLRVEGGPTDINFSNYQVLGGQYFAWTDTTETSSFLFSVDPDWHNVLYIREKDLAGNTGPPNSRIVANLSGDDDGDGMPNYWESMYRDTLDTQNASDAALDSDGDGRSNYEEFLAGTHPGDPSSVFAIVTVRKESGSGGLLLSWESVVGRQYDVLFSDRLPGEWSVLDEGIEGTGDTMSVRDDQFKDAASNRFYRVRVR
jgi:hypothetical protein